MNYATCDLCSGKGKINGSQKCPVCDGFGIWEFVADDNEAAVRFLLDPTADVSDHAKFICGERIHSVPPDHFDVMMSVLDQPTKISSFDELHEAGAVRWGWAWVHANRFAISLCRLNGGNSTEHAYGLTKLAWYWLDREKQEKVETPWVK